MCVCVSNVVFGCGLSALFLGLPELRGFVVVVYASFVVGAARVIFFR